MSGRHTFEAFAPDGARFTRTTARIYTHAVVGQPREGDPWHLCGFSGDPYNAARVQNRMLGPTWGWHSAHVVPARPVSRSTDNQACPYCAPDEPCALHTEPLS